MQLETTTDAVHARRERRLRPRLGLTWVCCCKGNAILGVERGFVLREGTKVDDWRGDPWAAGRGRRRRLSPWSSSDRCLEWRCWQLRRHGLDPSRLSATPRVWGASVWRPWGGRRGKTPVKFRHATKQKAAGSGDTHLLQVASRRIVSILWISSSMCAFPLAFHASSRTEPVSCGFRTGFEDFSRPQS